MVLQPLLKVCSANLLVWHPALPRGGVTKGEKPSRVLIKAKLANALICCSRLFWATLDRGDPFTSFKNIEKLSWIENQIKTKIITQFHSVIFAGMEMIIPCFRSAQIIPDLKGSLSAVSKLVKLGV